MDVSPQSYPDPLNPINYLCINPKCQQLKGQINENFCKSCGSALLLHQRYRVLDLLKLKSRRNRECILYDAIDTEHKEKPKVIKGLYTDNEKAIERFQLCARFLIDHWFKGIPHVDKEGYFHIEFPNDPIPAYCLVMEKIEGMNLQDWLEDRNHDPIHEEKAIDWLEQLANILCKLHEKNFYHRDIKPSNIMLRDRTNELILIDLDTGRAITDASREGIDITRVGTLGYQAPEQAAGNAVPQSDFYALGRTFVHLLTGKHPTDKDLMGKQAGKLNWKVHAQQQLQIFGSFASFIDKLMAWDQDERPRDAQEIVHRLKEIKQSLERQKKFKEILTFNQFKKWLNFKNFFAVIVFLIFVWVFYQARKHNPNENYQQINIPSSKQSPILNPLCKSSKQGKVENESKLGGEVQEYLKESIAATQDIELKQVKLHNVWQDGCGVIIIIRLTDQNALNSNLENKIRQLIKTRFDYVGKITVRLLEN